MTKKSSTTILGMTLLFVLMGGPQMTQAWAASPQEAQQQNPAAPAPAPTQQAQPDATPPANAQAVPDAPSTTQSQQAPEKKKEAPLGAATAQQGQTAGGAASKPAGSAIAPAKQRQMRSLLIKLGVIAAAGGAIGAVYALSRGTSSTPPGSGR